MNSRTIQGIPARNTRTQTSTRRPVLRIVLAVVVAAFLVMGTMAWYVGFHDRGMNLRFDPDAVAEVEARMWQAYYGGGSQVSLGMDLLRLMREQFGLSYNTAVRVAQDVATATIEFRGTREQARYEQRVLPSLVRGYTRLRDAVGGKWDPDEVARAELDWWVARREPERQAPETVGAAIAHEYALVYGKDNEHVQQAGLLRAQAAHLRDTSGQETDWSAIGNMLRDSYRELSLGVRE